MESEALAGATRMRDMSTTIMFTPRLVSFEKSIKASAECVTVLITDAACEMRNGSK